MLLLTSLVRGPRAAMMRAQPVSSLHTSAIVAAAPRPSAPRTKLKSHSAAKKRFFPVMGSGRGSPLSIKFKRTSSNKQHLNSGMSRVRLNRLSGTQVVSSGPVSRMLRRLLGPRL
ncbi:large ribosomal subunit protein [Malassezia pachydermatis]|uniref:50S ribosomal protein L35 n=1 Tax=Malassezia pachydermatis TaxID=77020 RepID=A0A0M8MS41_9BASI|nr:hypothetical protein Malapachy_0390 [Malassezia pachydermatis]KOS12670.1 hypothetical protein Malapachy_0390 [Malassezia pachydermatis]